MQLSELIEKKTAAVDIKGVALDSRQVGPGFLFAALKGEKTDGSNFIGEAIKKGAAAILADTDQKEIKDTILIREENPRRAFAKIVAKFYGTQPKVIAAVTGTNGKTSVGHFVRQIWFRMGKKSAAIGTLGVMADGLNYSTGLTTPDPIVLHKALKELAGHDVSHVILEASSHGLVQNRVDGADIIVAGFTNLSQDHMDYHADEENYFTAKARLFSEVLNKKGTAVINNDSPFGERLVKMMTDQKIKVITVGRIKADITLKNTFAEKSGQQMTFTYNGKEHSIFLPVLGFFQADNVLLAAGMVIATGFPAEKVFDTFFYLAGVTGRMEKVADTPNGAEVYIDYAHTPDGLKHALFSMRDHTIGKLHLVFGCGGERDTAKRPKMGGVAEALADYVYITDDNPRNENPFEIRQEILEGCPMGEEFVDRGDAIRYGVRAMKPDDVLFITGKGNETGQIVAGKVLPFSDKEVVKETIAKMIEEQK